MPELTEARKPSSSPSTAWADIRGTRAVMIDTAATPYGSWKKAKAVNIAVGPPCTPLASTRPTPKLNWLATT
jgi:hypothetical protein